LGFETDVYRKAISANTILHFHSYHAKSQKVGLIYFFVRRAVKICSTKEALDKELGFLRSNFIAHAYPAKLIDAHFRKAVAKFKTPIPVPLVTNAKERKSYFAFPYTGIDNSYFKRICNNANIILGQTPGTKIINLRARFKETVSTSDQSNIVYKINCSQCPKSYIGETGRHLKTRIKEHERATVVKDANYATYTHTADTGHTMDFNNVQILDRAKNYNHRLHLEAAHIASNKEGLNCNIGKREPRSAWKTVLTKYNVKQVSQQRTNVTNSEESVNRVSSISQQRTSVTNSEKSLNRVSSSNNTPVVPENNRISLIPSDLASQSDHLSPVNRDVREVITHKYNLRSRKEKLISSLRTLSHE
jgi:hypothetical protein